MDCGASKDKGVVLSELVPKPKAAYRARIDIHWFGLKRGEYPHVDVRVTAMVACGRDTCLASCSKTLEAAAQDADQRALAERKAAMPRTCFHCRAPDMPDIRTLQRCERCKQTYFCNEQCQKAAFSKHKAECKAAARAAKAASAAASGASAPSPST